MSEYEQLMARAKEQNIDLEDKYVLIPRDENRFSINEDLCFGRVFEDMEMTVLLRDDDAMKIDMQHITVTLHYPVDIPNKNGAIFTHDAVQNALEEVKNQRIPIVDYTQDNRGKVIGVTIPSVFYKTYDGYAINNDCFFFDDTYIKEFDMEYMINKSHKDQDDTIIIDDFRIMSMSIVEDEI